MIKKAIHLSKHLKTKKLNDEYLTWLAFANAGMLNQGNSYCMDYALKNLVSDNPIIEIGSFCGLSTNIISYLLEKHGRKNKIITSDRWIFEGSEKGGNLANSSINHTEYRTFIMDSFKKNVSFFSKNNLPFPIEVFSDDFFEMWDKNTPAKDLFNRDIELGGNISFAFIDGNHTYDYAKRDYENVAKNLDVGGFILFDDSADWYEFGCATLMKEIVKNPNFELVMKNPNYLFKKIK